MRYSITTAAIAAILAIAAPAYALTATQIVEKEVVIKQADGTELIERQRAEKVTPGQRVVYTLNFTNDALEPATDLVLTMPVPEELKFVDGSATKSGAVAVYSADGGQTFANRLNLRVKGIDGALRSAGAAEITHVRWTVPGPLAAGETGSLSFKGTLK